MKPDKELDVDVIGSQDEPLTDEEAQKLHEYFQHQKNESKEKMKLETRHESKEFNTESK